MCGFENWCEGLCVANDGGSSNSQRSTSMKEGAKCCHLKKYQLKIPKIIIGRST